MGLGGCEVWWFGSGVGEVRWSGGVRVRWGRGCCGGFKPLLVGKLLVFRWGVVWVWRFVVVVVAWQFITVTFFLSYIDYSIPYLTLPTLEYLALP